MFLIIFSVSASRLPEIISESKGCLLYNTLTKSCQQMPRCSSNCSRFSLAMLHLLDFSQSHYSFSQRETLSMVWITVSFKTIQCLNSNGIWCLWNAVYKENRIHAWMMSTFRTLQWTDDGDSISRSARLSGYFKNRFQRVLICKWVSF